jgi:protein SERAC1
VPIIFVAHSLGGIVCANACAAQYDTEEIFDEGYLRKLTTGVLFLSTPFPGSLPPSDNTREWTEVAENFRNNLLEPSKGAQSQPKVQVDRVAKIDTDFFEALHILNDQADGIKISFFCERPPLKRGAITAPVIVGDDSIRYESTVFETDHLSICRYKDAKSAVYQEVAEKIKEWANIIDLTPNRSVARGREKIWKIARMGHRGGAPEFRPVTGDSFI